MTDVLVDVVEIVVAGGGEQVAPRAPSLLATLVKS